MQSFVLDHTPWNPPSWSVGVELLCYAVFPLTIWLLRRAPDLLLAGLAATLALAEARVLHLYGSSTVGTGAVLRGLVGFHLGTVSCLLLPHLPVRAAPVASLFGLVGIVFGISTASSITVVLAAAVMIVALAPDRGPVTRALSWDPLVWLGRVSFSVYLLHADLQIVLIRALSRFIGPGSMAMIFLAILIPLSGVTYRFIEQPGRRLPGLMKTRSNRRLARMG